METVGTNVRNFFSGFVDEFGFTQKADPSKSVKSVETSRKTVVCNTNNLKDASFGQITSEIGQRVVNERDSLLNKTSDNSTQVNTIRFEDRVFYDDSFHSDATGFEYSDWGIENILDLDLNIDNNVIEGEPSMNLEEKKTELNNEFDLNTPITHQSSDMKSSVTCNENQEENTEHVIAGGLSSEKLYEPLNSSLKTDLNNEFEYDLNTSIAHQSSELESSVTYNENKEENTEHIIAGGLSSENFQNSFYSSLKNFTSEADKNDCNPTETMDDFSVASDVLSSCGSFTTLAYDSNNEADVSCSGTGLADGVTVDFEDAKKGAVDSSVISGKLSSSPKTSRNKSYKKMIQDAFMSRKRLAKEYKQLAILYGDIDKELCQPTESQSSRLPVQLQDGPDSEWELL
ncbi:uncharacterized protein LOC143615532 isoform X2 [Bidens hawaiensis]